MGGIVSGLLGGPKAPPVPTLPPVETVEPPKDDAAAVAAAEEARKKNAKRRGRQSTILTGSTGVADATAGSTVILGG